MKKMVSPPPPTIVAMASILKYFIMRELVQL